MIGWMRSLKIIGKKNKLLRGAITITAQRKLSRTGGAFIKTVSLNKGDYLQF
jgi:hypothetical protein